MSNKIQKLLILSVFGLLIMALTVSVLITVENNRAHREILDSAVKSNLLSIAYAARELIDVEAFYTYKSIGVIEADIEAFDATLGNLKSLKDKTGATYIYTLRKLDGEIFFIFDTDPEIDTIYEMFVAYEEVTYVHREAFAGLESAGIMNVADRWGSFNTSAIPIWHNYEVIGIVSVDIEDTFIRAYDRAAFINIVVLIVLLAANKV